MKKRILIIVGIIALAVITAAVIFSLKFTAETGIYAVSPSDRVFYISEKDDTPTVIDGKIKYIGSPENSDKILVIRDKLVMESYPAQTKAYICIRLGKNEDPSREINAQNYPELAKMGWIEGYEPSASETLMLTKCVPFQLSTVFIPESWISEFRGTDDGNEELIIRPSSDSDGYMKWTFYPQNDFAVCGTGLITNEIILNNGTKASVGYYDGSTDWSFVRLNDFSGYVFLNEGLTGDDALTALEIIRTIDKINPGGVDDTLQLIDEEPKKPGGTEYVTEVYSTYEMNSTQTPGNKPDPAEPTVGQPYFIQDPDGNIANCFLIKEVSGNLVTLSRYEKDRGELKAGLFRGNIPDTSNTQNVEFKAGDIVTVVYAPDIAETYPYPYQINIVDMYFSVWN